MQTTLYDVVKKLLGPIEPTGETNEDDRRYANLNETIELVDQLLCDIGSVAQDETRQEHSMARAGKRAKQFLTDIKEC